MTGTAAPQSRPVLYLSAPPGSHGIPADVFASLGHAIGVLWPNARMSPGLDGRGFGLVIDDQDRARKVSKKALREGWEPRDPDSDDFAPVGWDGEALSVTTPAEAAEALAHWAHAMLAGLDAKNYVEQTAVTEDGRTVVATARWAEGLTPHQARQQAEEQTRSLSAAARQVLAWAQHRDGCPGGGEPGECTCGLAALAAALPDQP